MSTKIAILGDSITWGANDIEAGGWAERLKLHFLRLDAGVFVYNVGISADTSDDLLRRIDGDLAARHPTIVLIAIGINDSCQYSDTLETRVSLEQYQANLVDMIDRCQEAGATPLCVGLTRVDESKTKPVYWAPTLSLSNAIIEQFDTALREFCSDQSIPYINLSSQHRNEDYPDGVHPNAAGHEQIFRAVLSQLRSMIE